MRQIILDTETTGLSPSDGHRIIEIGCLEVVNRRITGNNLHLYIQPERDIDREAQEVHGITAEFLADKPVFAEIAEQFIAFVKGAELIIHNAPFDIGFLNYELLRFDRSGDPITDYCSVIDTLVLARNKHPGQKNSLDALCRRYHVDNSNRELHGALLDSELLAQVYLLMTGGQTQLFAGEAKTNSTTQSTTEIQRLAADRTPLPVIDITKEEADSHQSYIDMMEKSNGSKWQEFCEVKD